MTIDLFCPSRGRPQAARELLDNFDKTKRLDTTRLIFILDSDDQTQWDYPRVAFAGRQIYEPIHGPSTGDPVGPLNREALKSKADIVGYIGDDSRFETQGWDLLVEKAINDAGGGFCWANDGHEKPWPSTVFISREIVQTLGWLALPTTKRGYFDAVWIHLATATGRAIALPEVMIRHNNVGEGVRPDIIESDRIASEAWAKTQSRKDAAAIRSLYSHSLRPLER